MTTAVVPQSRPDIVTHHGIMRMRVLLPRGAVAELLLGEGWAVWVCGDRRWRASVGEG